MAYRSLGQSLLRGVPLRLAQLLGYQYGYSIAVAHPYRKGYRISFHLQAVSLNSQDACIKTSY